MKKFTLWKIVSGTMKWKWKKNEVKPFTCISIHWKWKEMERAMCVKAYSEKYTEYKEYQRKFEQTIIIVYCLCLFQSMRPVKERRFSINIFPAKNWKKERIYCFCFHTYNMWVWVCVWCVSMYNVLVAVFIFLCEYKQYYTLLYENLICIGLKFLHEIK